MEPALHYPEFEYPGTELFKYMTISNDFTIMLKDADIIQYVPDNEITFKKWLDDNNIQNIRGEKGWVIDN